jgi:hypothetical protein
MNFETETDRANERLVADAIEAAWPGSKVHSFGEFSPVDWWITRNRRMQAIAELKSRNVPSTVGPTAYLSVRKWVDLQRFAFTFCMPTFFFVRFPDCVKYIDVREVTGVVAMGTNPRALGRNDTEPVILVPIAGMLTLGE